MDRGKGGEGGLLIRLSMTSGYRSDNTVNYSGATRVPFTIGHISV